MIKVYINNEYFVKFNNQEQLNNWLQSQDCYENITIEYEED